MHSEDKTKVYTDFWGLYKLVSQASFSPNSVDMHSLLEHRKIGGYIYLRYLNVVNGKLMARDTTKTYNVTEYGAIFVGRDKIYNNGGSEVYR